MLRARLRISALDSGDGAALLDSIVEEVRINLYEELGDTLIAEILETAYVSEATTSGQLTRLRAMQVELLWVRTLLMERAPVLFLTSVGLAQQTWNQDPIAREAGERDLRRTIASNMATINRSLAILRGDEDEQGMLVSVIEPDETPDGPGDSISPSSVSGGAF